MSIVIIRKKVEQKDIEIAKEEYGSYIKIVCDTKRNVIAIGGEWHADAEKLLLDDGSKQEDLWGGGIDIENKNIDLIALINLQPSLGRQSQEILDIDVRKRFVGIVKDKFNL